MRTDLSPSPGPISTRPEGEVTSSCLAYLDRAAQTLREASVADRPGERYALAHVAALRASAALLAARARPARPRARSRRQRSAWMLVGEVAPEFAEWAVFFAAGARKRAAAEAGSPTAVTERDADDLLRDSDRYLALIERSLGLTPHPADLIRAGLA